MDPQEPPCRHQQKLATRIPFIAREGWPFLGIAVAVCLLVTWFVGWWSLPFWLLAVFILQFFRDPPRDVPDGRGRGAVGRPTAAWSR